MSSYSSNVFFHTKRPACTKASGFTKAINFKETNYMTSKNHPQKPHNLLQRGTYDITLKPTTTTTKNKNAMHFRTLCHFNWWRPSFFKQKNLLLRSFFMCIFAEFTLSHMKSRHKVSGQISIIPKPELRGFWGSSLIKPPFRVTSADVVIICPESVRLDAKFT